MKDTLFEISMHPPFEEFLTVRTSTSNEFVSLPTERRVFHFAHDGTTPPILGNWRLASSRTNCSVCLEALKSAEMAGNDSEIIKLPCQVSFIFKLNKKYLIGKIHAK